MYKYLYHSRISLCLLLSFCSLLSLSKPVFADDPVTLLKLDWSSQQVLSHIAGELLTEKGIAVDYIQARANGQWFLLSSGSADVQMEVWEGSMAKQFERQVQQGRVIDAGDHNTITREEWWFPAYVTQLCPGLPNWQALNACASLFATPDSDGKGVYYTGPWEKPDRARIHALNLNYTVIELKDGPAINQVLTQAIAKQQPILIFNWTPNWVEVIHEGAFVEFPPYDPACESDPGWGINNQYPWDCGNPSGGWLKKAISAQLPKKSPCAAKLIKAMVFTNQDIAEITLQVDINNLSVEAAAKHWLENNDDRKTQWLTLCD